MVPTLDLTAIPEEFSEGWDDGERVAGAAGLVYLTDEEPGFTRHRWGTGFTYRYPDGTTVRDRKLRARFQELAIPPAWTEVWISPHENGHLQATGRDTRGRKQYLYHRWWRGARDYLKFRRLVDFGHALPALRRAVGRDLQLEGLPRERVLAAALRLLDRGAIRVGSPEYARANGSYGLTTLRDKHVEADGNALHLQFDGKSGRAIELTVEDPALVAVVREALKLPGDEVLKYVDEDANVRSLTAEDVNNYIRTAAGGPFTARDFRTWTATTCVVSTCMEAGECEEGERLGRWLEAVDAAADLLRNTRSVARNAYLPPSLEPLYVRGKFFSLLWMVRKRAEELAEPGRRTEECWTLALLEACYWPDRPFISQVA